MISKKEFIEGVRPKLRFYVRYVTRLYRALSYLRIVRFTTRGDNTSGFVLLSICNRKSFRMVKLMLSSFMKNSEHLPAKIVLVSDGTWTAEDGMQYFSDFKDLIEFDDWSDCAKYCSDLGYKDLEVWAGKHIWGKKMAAIVKYANKSLVLFSDPDVLWYKSPLREEDFKKDKLLKLSIDNSHNYDDRVIEALKVNYLYDYMPINCGVVLMKGNLLAQSPRALECVEYEAQDPGNFAEQTVLALMNYEMGATWSEDEITASIDDVVAPVFVKTKYKKELIARHYLWALKWHYWKDYFFKV